ncbi:MAG: hypothetical protein JEZ12_16145 [Desulfobacterium sp.]|nr:hypothetical protein [Desulfobacterium sp.]
MAKPRCTNKVPQYVPRGFGFKKSYIPCGATGINGETAICSECQNRLSRQYPQGWKHTPGDICKHGQFVGDAGGPDYICSECEEGKGR